MQSGIRVIRSCSKVDWLTGIWNLELVISGTILQAEYNYGTRKDLIFKH